MTYMLQLEEESYNYRNKDLILYNQELDYICIIRNFFIDSFIISLLLEDITSHQLIILIPFS